MRNDFLSLGVVTGLFLLHSVPMISAEEGRARKPLPTPEEVAGLPADGGEKFNRLVFEKSPYLLQHARNPIAWWPWSEEAFAEAKRLDKPVFLSVGYATCHWCHVMEHESFEDEEVAALINERFIAIKVDREERPDIDDVYMQVTQAMTGSGGWPMTVMMTPDKHPFFAGTYFPKESLAGRPGIKLLITEMHKAWVEKRDEVESTATAISEQLGSMMVGSPGGDLDVAIFDTAYEQFAAQYDAKLGGFAMRPKFPVPPNLNFLMRYHLRSGNPGALEMVEKTLTEMRRGGIYDQVGFGMHRYSTDRAWLVPHFEKMLYDQALVAVAYLEAYQITGKEFYARTAREILAYVDRDMKSVTGGFYSAEDADSEGVEGKFYVWTNAEIREVLGEEDGDFYIETFHLTDEGNFLEEATQVRTGANIPHLKEELLDEARERVEGLRVKLHEAREKRVHPFKDDKILTDWNGLMISAYAKAAKILGDEAYAATAAKAADFVLTELRNEDGRLLKRYRQGESGLTAHIEDYAFMIHGLLDLYETNFEVRSLAEAIALQAIADEFFLDAEKGGYFTVAEDAEQLIVRAKKLYGGAIPSGNAVSISNLSRLYRMTGNPDYAKRNDGLIRAFSGEIGQQPMVYPVALCGLDFTFGPAHEIVISGEKDSEDTRAMIDALRKEFRPNQVILLRTPENAGALAKLAPYTETQLSINGKATAYVCRNFTCKVPTNEVATMLESIRE
jgi:uncharacterized protein YyaL (SSP411 family)